MNKKDYDVIIIGGGPAGIFTALELIEKDEDLNILLLEKGKNIDARSCPIGKTADKCIKCNPCSIVTGWGGAGAFSDGKLTLTTEFGGVLDKYITKERLEELIDYIDKIYVRFGGTEEIHGMDQQKVLDIEKKAASADLKLIKAHIKHLGTDKNYEILKKIQYYLQDKINIEFLTSVEEIIVKDNKAVGVKTNKGDTFYAKYIAASPGREGSEWFKGESERLGLGIRSNAVDVGVRVEVPAVVMKDITDVVYESKLIYYTESFDDRVRTFCMNPYGEVVIENNDGIKTVNGHSYADKRTDKTNFALLVSKEFTEPFDSPIAYGKYIASLANMLGEGVLVQRLGDLLDGRRSTHKRLERSLLQPSLKDATPGDLSLVLPYRFLQDIVEMLKAMDKVAPGIYSKHTLLYGVEVKFYSSRVDLDSKLETKVENLFAGGDGAGVTRGLAQASAAGVVMATEMLNRIES